MKKIIIGLVSFLITSSVALGSYPERGIYLTFNGSDKFRGALKGECSPYRLKFSPLRSNQNAATGPEDAFDLSEFPAKGNKNTCKFKLSVGNKSVDLGSAVIELDSYTYTSTGESYVSPVLYSANLHNVTVVDDLQDIFGKPFTASFSAGQYYEEIFFTLDDKFYSVRPKN